LSTHRPDGDVEAVLVPVLLLVPVLEDWDDVPDAPVSPADVDDVEDDEEEEEEDVEDVDWPAVVPVVPVPDVPVLVDVVVPPAVVVVRCCVPVEDVCDVEALYGAV
jgi:hypothetical protein